MARLDDFLAEQAALDARQGEQMASVNANGFLSETGRADARSQLTATHVAERQRLHDEWAALAADARKANTAKLTAARAAALAKRRELYAQIPPALASVTRWQLDGVEVSELARRYDEAAGDAPTQTLIGDLITPRLRSGDVQNGPEWADALGLGKRIAADRRDPTLDQLESARAELDALDRALANSHQTPQERQKELAGRFKF